MVVAWSRIMNRFSSIFAGLLMFLFSASVFADADVCAPFKDGVVDESIVSKMLAAAVDGHLYRIESSSSKVAFCVESPVGLIEGEFKDFTGGLTFLQHNVSEDEQALVLVRTASLETDGALIKNMLKGKKFFDVKNFPEILFVSTGFRWVSQTEAVLQGRLTMHGVTKDVGFHVELIEQPSENQKEQRILVKATTLIRRSEFGLTALSPMVSDAVNLCMSVDAVKYRS
ncbi:MAG: YceI family protein [Gammaproteobacteria bacterium]|nr:YceI family protein [Gammaproteobacteria bacterium]